MPIVSAFHVPDVSVPTPVIPVYDPDSRPVGNVPLLMLLAFVVSVVAEAANATLFVFVQVITPAFVIVQSRLITAKLGSALPPCPSSSAPLAPTAVVATAFVPFPTNSPCAASVVSPVPPCGTVTTPVSDAVPR